VTTTLDWAAILFDSADDRREDRTGYGYATASDPEVPQA